MILRLSSPASRGAIVLLAIMLAAGFSYSGFRNALAAHEAGLNTVQGYLRATQLEPNDASNWYLLGRYWQYNLEDPDAGRAIHAYQTAASLDPRSADIWLDLGTAYESQGKIADARNAFLQAMQDYPLSPEVSWRYGNFLLRQGALDAAFAQIKRAVEVDPKRGAAAFALCLRVEPDVDAVFARALPRSQEAYLGVISSLTDHGQTDQALAVWSRLAALHPKFRLGESFPLLEALIHIRRMSDARRVWDQALVFAGVSRPPDPADSLVWDGGFEANVAGGGFSWRYPRSVSGAQINLDAKEKHSGNRSLRLTFNGLHNLNFADVCQYIPVQPSVTYRFSAWVRTRSLSTDQGIRFGLRSINGSDNPVAWTNDVRGTTTWTQVSLPWTSGKITQELQICISRLPSAEFDTKISGSAWIDDVALAPESPERIEK